VIPAWDDSLITCQPRPGCDGRTAWGADLLEREAREEKYFQRARAVASAVDLLRLAFAYCLGQTGLRLTAAWAETVGLASLSNVALLKPLRKMAPWLERMVGRLIGPGGPVDAAQALA
jgi:hypothetical protein